MPTDRTTDFLRELLVRQLTTWLPAALHRSRRATVALAGVDPGSSASMGPSRAGRSASAASASTSTVVCRPRVWSPCAATRR
ncbi:hypothetical protein ACWCOX_30660, partial [Micromonospora parva]